jgi:malonate-semialdehyde dehydrogenase (acetylating)/methylmalonate-semialdehyde dehydrogenase
LTEVLRGESGLNETEVAIELEQTLEAIVYALTAMQAKGSSTPAWGNTDVWVQHAMQPVGVVAIISNEEQTLKSLVSEIVVALLCGNTLIVKPHPSHPLLPVLLGDWLAQSGLPLGRLQCVQGDEEVAKALHVHPNVNAITYVLANLLPNKPMRVNAKPFWPTITLWWMKAWMWTRCGSSIWPAHRSVLSVPIWLVIGERQSRCLLQQKWQKHLATLPAMVLPTEAKQSALQ